MPPFLLIAAMTVRAAFPPFAVDGVPGRYAEALPNLFMSSVTRGGCAEGVGDTAIDNVTSGAISGCGNDPACVTQVSSTLLVDFVVLGSLQREGSSFRMKLDVVDTSRRSSAKKLEKSFDSLLNGVPGAIADLSASLCKVLQTTKPATDRRARKDAPPAPAAAPVPKAPPGEDLSLDLPPIDEPAPPEQQVAAVVPPPTPPPPAPEMIIPLTPPPPPVVSSPPPTPPPPPAVKPEPPPAPVAIAPPAPAPMVGPPVPPPAPPVPTPVPTPPEAKAATIVPPPALAPAAPATPGPSAGEVMRKLPWNWILIGAAAVSTGVGIYYGASSNATWGNDHPTVVNGVTQHTISRVDAVQANKQAVNANISFAVGGALAAGGGVLFLVKF